MHFYLDESGDLGWTFTKPYRHGGSSRFLTIGVLQVPKDKAHIPKRLIRKLYNQFGWNPKHEKKWSQMKPEERERFAVLSFQMSVTHPDIHYHSICVNKQKVSAHIRADSNKLYNYMIKLLLIDEMSRHPEIKFFPDPRTIKIESGNSLHDYLQTTLWFEKEVSSKIITIPCDSSADLCIQFSDMLCGLVQHHFEDAKSEPFEALARKLKLKCLYFGTT